MSLATPSNAPIQMHRGQPTFHPVQLNIAVSKKISNECCGQTAADKMFKFLEEVKIVILFTAAFFKIMSWRKLAINLEKHPRTQFWSKTSIWEKMQCSSNFHATFKIKLSDLIIYIYLDTKMSEKNQFKEFCTPSLHWNMVWWHKRVPHIFFLDLWPKMLSFDVEICQKEFLKTVQFLFFIFLSLEYPWQTCQHLKSGKPTPLRPGVQAWAYM